MSKVAIFFIFFVGENEFRVAWGFVQVKEMCAC